MNNRNDNTNHAFDQPKMIYYSLCIYHQQLPLTPCLRTLFSLSIRVVSSFFLGDVLDDVSSSVSLNESAITHDLYNFNAVFFYSSQFIPIAFVTSHDITTESAV